MPAERDADDDKPLLKTAGLEPQTDQNGNLVRGRRRRRGFTRAAIHEARHGVTPPEGPGRYA